MTTCPRFQISYFQSITIYFEASHKVPPLLGDHLFWHVGWSLMSGSAVVLSFSLDRSHRYYAVHSLLNLFIFSPHRTRMQCAPQPSPYLASCLVLVTALLKRRSWSKFTQTWLVSCYTWMKRLTSLRYYRSKKKSLGLLVSFRRG